MQGIITLIFFVVVLIAWVAQQKKGVEKEKEKKKKQLEKKHTQTFPKEVDINRSVPGKSLRESHLVGDHLTESKDEENIIIVASKKIETLSKYKRAIIWSELLDKPLSLREQKTIGEG
ncbi:MAG: hypothetical protein OCD02_17385 [Spirochaetaceae bacterium]